MTVSKCQSADQYPFEDLITQLILSHNKGEQEIISFLSYDGFFSDVFCACVWRSYDVFFFYRKAC